MLWQKNARHKKEYTILVSSWVIASVLLCTLTPRNKVKHSMIAFLFHQVLTWLFGLLVVEKELIKYPVRLFQKSKTSFTFEYFVFPALSALFNVRFPEKANWFCKFLYYFYYPTIITLFEVYAEKRTKLIEYIRWNWFYSFITMFLSFFVSRQYYLWFFSKKESDVDVDFKC
ncbi:hypothetical protein BKP35_11765 [Anaerobacillus arseniciselenatis]|uniref:Uncharacterized protein n=1 Tax=Anaerobacillus arseniciselenatis TaxID=85682 RepID=A0A1S2LHA9_9BACI|nr:CBO0543 family protein [Anaerobacillus arseniciselenatis]OIJ11610.1 hypothetical protein BKP35_11765 [Anaerobacillus arseniciselenatis]